MTTKEKRVQWMEHLEKVDPGYRKRPVVTYVFDQGKRVFHKAKRPNNGIRKG